MVVEGGEWRMREREEVKKKGVVKEGRIDLLKFQLY